MLQLSLSTGEPLILKPTTNRHFRGQHIPGSSLFMAEKAGCSVSIHLFSHRLYKITIRHFRFTADTRIVTREKNGWLRLEMPLSGTVNFLTQAGIATFLNPGQYQISKEVIYGSDFQAGETVYFAAYFSKELLDSIGSAQDFTPVPPRPVPHELLEMVDEMMKCPYRDDIRSFYYANKIRELLFSHIASLPNVLPGELNDVQIASMYEADRIMANNLDGKITIPELAKKLGTNFVTLKKNYEKVFGIGIFPRMIQRKMEFIERLLENTNMPLKEIADQAGYQTLPGFINAFRKRYKMTPKEWRKKRRGL